MVAKRTIAVIPARGGSKRIPGKNIIDFYGKPLIAWTIEAAINSGVFDDVIVNTDDLNIKEVAETYGAQVPFLRQNHADDFAPISIVTVDTLKILEQNFNKQYTNVVQLMANCPIRDSEDIKNAYQNFQDNNCDFQISCFEYGWMNPWWAFKIDPTTKQPLPLFEFGIKSRSQDLERLYCPTGAIWIAKVKKLFISQTFYGEGFKFHQLPWTKAIDIDDYEDLNMAKAVYQLNKGGK
jgi:CMP-N-acetylneuraminic acid synthetase